MATPLHDVLTANSETMPPEQRVGILLCPFLQPEAYFGERCAWSLLVLLPVRAWSPAILLAGRLPEGCHNEVVRVQLWSSKGKKTWLRLGQSIIRTFQHPSLKPELEDL